MVPRATWGATDVPSYMQMYIYVPDKMATKPPIYVSCHSCGSTATGQISNIPMAKATADSYGFILVLPDNPGQNCWDVGTTMSLTHDGGGDTQGLAQMMKYTLTKYDADPTRVYIMGGSGGAMMTQAMLAVYPDLFAAGAARAGVAAGCWSSGYDSSNQWSNNCAGGNVTHDGGGVGHPRSQHGPGLHRPPAAPADVPGRCRHDHQLQEHGRGHQGVDQRPNLPHHPDLDAERVQGLASHLEHPALGQLLQLQRPRGLDGPGRHALHELRGGRRC